MKDRHKPGYNNTYQRENYENIRLRVRKGSTIKAMLAEASARKNVSINEYVLSAIAMALQKDGYNAEN